MIELRVLGPIELLGGQDPDELIRHPRDLAILAYVNVTGALGGYCTREQVSAVFWPESSASRSRNALNQALHRIRRATADDVLDVQGQGLKPNRDRMETDVGCFWGHLASGEVEAAVALYRGPLLAGLHIRRAGPFEDWLEKERARLKSAATDAARRLRESAAERDEPYPAISIARRAAEISDREEEDIRRLIQLLAEVGDRVAALREYERFSRWMVSEMEIEPSPETRALIQPLLAEPKGGGTRSGSESSVPERSDSGKLHPGVMPEGPALAAPRGPTSTEDSARPGSKRRRRYPGVLPVAAGLAVAALGILFVAQGRTGSAPDLDLSPDALVYYRRGDEYLRAGNEGGREGNWRLSLEMFQRAAELSPRSAAAHAAVGVAHLRLFHWGLDRSTERQVMAKQAIDRGSELDPGHPEVTRALGWYYHWAERDYARALDAGQQTLEALPDDIGALTLIFAASRRAGRAADALPALQRLVREGGGATYRAEWVATLIGLRAYADALDVVDQGLGLSPTHGLLRYQKWLTTLLATGDPAAGERVLAEALARLGPRALWPVEFGQLWLGRHYHEALGVLEREQPETFHIQQGSLPVALMFGLVHRLAGDEEEARRSYSEAIQPLHALIRDRPDEPWFHGWLAVALAGAGDRELALAEISTARELAELEPDPWENPFLMQEVVLHAYIMCGEHDRAIELLAELLESSHYRAISRPWVEMDPRFDPLRGHPKWSEISSPQ